MHMAAVGSAVIDFGSSPGSNEASVAVTGQTGILSGSSCDAWIVAKASSDHSVSDHTYAAVLIGISTSAPSAGAGFTIYARCLDRMQGTFNIEWAWA